MKGCGNSSTRDQKIKIRKRKRSEQDEAVNQKCDESNEDALTLSNHTSNIMINSHGKFNSEMMNQQNFFSNYQYILAPMVGASELPFRLFCRKYGAQLCYTPMMSSQSFAKSSDYRKEYFGNANSERVHCADHPIYAHVYANTVSDFVAAAQQALAMGCDGIDLNLGCPQRTAYIGHYGSYLCTNDTQTHHHISNMLSAAARSIQRKIPISAKIRLLHPMDSKPTLDLCRTLYNNGTGASLIAIHARPRASWERTGHSARDGLANLQQVTSIVQAIHDGATASSDDCTHERLRIITNGNTITYDDVANNLQSTMADGIMSAEGLLDNPALYLPRLFNDGHGNNNNNDASSRNIGINSKMRKSYVTVWTLKEEFRYKYHNYKPIEEFVTDNDATIIGSNCNHDDGCDPKAVKIQSIQMKLRKIEEKLQVLNEKQSPSSLSDQKTQMKYERYRNKQNNQQKKLQKLIGSGDIRNTAVDISPMENNKDGTHHSMVSDGMNSDPYIERRTLTVQSLAEIAADKVLLGMEYLDWATIYPTTMRTIVFHIRRMCKAELVQYQLLQPCLQATTIDTIRNILNRIIQYRINPDTFVYDSQRAQEEKEAIARQKYEEGKRKAFEERMIRKAKREKKDDLFYYLNIGAELPTRQQMEFYRTLDLDTLIPIWKRNHSQHCISYHMDPKQCQRGRACAFLHVDTNSKMSLQETDERAG